MTALTQDKYLERTDGVELSFPVGASQKIYGGALVAVNAAGYLLPGADTAGLIFQGVSTEQKDNSSGSNGDLSCNVRRRGLVKCVIASASQANIGDNVFLVDDQTVGLAATTTNDIFCGIIAGYIDSTHVWVDIEPAIRQADVATHIADTDGAHAASAISIADAGSYTSQTQVEAALQELYLKAGEKVLADPGDAGAIPVTGSGNCNITTTGAETRTLAIPAADGLTIIICMDTDGGDCVIASAQTFNQTGNNRITLNDAGDTVVLKGVKVGGARRWRVVVNDGATLATA